MLGVVAYTSPVEISGDLLHIVRVLKAPRCDHLRQNGKLSWYHTSPGSCANQDQPAAARGILEGKLLRKHPTPGNAEHINPNVAQLVKHFRHEPCVDRKAI